MSLNVIDLFCGCGGLSLGFEKAGYHTVLGIDAWQDALDTYQFNRTNATVMCADLTMLHPQDVIPKIGDVKIDVIIGGPPCQGFSVAGKRIIDDYRNTLYKNFVEFVKFFKPKAFVMENVPNILSMGGGIIKDEIIKDFTLLGYTIEYKVLTASDYGVPQNRRRAFFVGLLDGKNFIFPNACTAAKVTSFEALSDLTKDSIEDGGKYPTEPQSVYQELMRKNSSQVYNHEITSHNQQTQDIIAMVPDGGNYKDLPLNLQQTRKVHIAWTRLNSKRPSFTIDCGHRHHFHYKWNRVPTVRECARIQSFPDEFIFCKSKTSQYKQVGNAVPPLMAYALAKQLKQYI
ncbi:MAG: DNA cytosine methyltransferase [Muribaculaceae bacterium]|nr:DNA cytosine methyltransferase [Muribaculaceae bacterium]